MSTWPMIRRGPEATTPLSPRTAPVLPQREVTRLAGAPWRALCPPHAVELRDPTLDQLRRLPPLTTLVLVSDRPGSRGRLRRLAAAGGISVDRELIVVPGTARPVVLLDDVESAVRHFWTVVATVPPGLTRAAVPAAAFLHAARACPWSWTGALVPGRVLIGRTP